MMAERFVLDASLSGLDLLERWIEQGYVAGLNNRLRIRPVAASPGHVGFECTLDADHENFVGLVHGGVAAALTDIAGGAAAMSLLEPGETLLTTDLNLRFLQPSHVAGGTMTAEARTTYNDRRRVVAEVRISSAGIVTAIGTVGISIRRPEKLS
jgi:uncharacterized protein (TIGR00369 family)